MNHSGIAQKQTIFFPGSKANRTKSQNTVGIRIPLRTERGIIINRFHKKWSGIRSIHLWKLME
jgi:hypothetical protein